jgi:phenylpropionate dioxygenase-like ring-hydroxylating dioxygenase large terminal subunit
MRPETQRNLVGQVLALHAEQTTMMAEATLKIPAEHYTSEDHASRERSGWFLNQPHLATLSSEVPEPGDFVAYEIAGVPIVVVRGPDGVARAFENVCRHRAAPVARGRGTGARVLACPFHGWSYDAGTGRLLSQPQSCDGFTSEDKAALGLRSLQCEERHGLIVVDPRREAATLDVEDWLPGLADEVASNDYASFVPLCSSVDRWSCNWKLLLDTFFESYHVFTLHRESLASDYLGIASTAHAFGPHNRLVVPMRSILDLAEKPRDSWELMPSAVVQYFAAPNVILSHYHGVLAMTRFVPLAASETEVTQTLLTRGPVISEAERAAHEEGFKFAHAITAREDYPESVRVHQNLASGRVDHTVIGRNEAGVGLFHTAIARSLEGPQVD